MVPPPLLLPLTGTSPRHLACLLSLGVCFLVDFNELGRNGLAISVCQAMPVGEEVAERRSGGGAFQEDKYQV